MFSILFVAKRAVRKSVYILPGNCSPTSRFSNLCFSDCKVCDSCVKVSAGPLDTSPIVFLVPASFLLPPGRASPRSAPLWLSHRANFEVSSLIVSFWFMIVSFCCKTVSRSCITVVFKSSPGTLFCKVAEHMSISLGTDVQMNCVCPPKSWDELSKKTQENRKSFQQISLFAARMSPSAPGFTFLFIIVFNSVLYEPQWLSPVSPLLLYSVSASAAGFYTACPVLRRAALTASQPVGREGGGGRAAPV